MEILKTLFKDSLYKNSIYLMINAGIMALLGFVFWTLAARCFSIEEVGLASTLISAIGIIATFSLLGFNISLIRFLPKTKEKNKLIWSSFWLCSLTALIFGTIFILITAYLYPEFNFIQNKIIYIILFVVFTIFNVLFNLIESVFIAYRKSHLVLFKNTLWSLLKVGGLMFFLVFGAYGIFMSWYIALILAFFISLLFFGLKVIFVVDLKKVKSMFKYSFNNYLGNIFAMLPSMGLPLFITYFLGVEQTAYFYVAWMISNLLFFVPQSVGKSLLSEGSHDPKNGGLDKALKFTYVIVCIGLIIGLVLSKSILGIFGTNYVENGLGVLIILLLSSLFYSYNSLIVMHYNLLEKVETVIFIYAGIALFTFGLSYILLDYNLIGVVISWFVANLLMASLINIKRLWSNND